MTGNIFRTVSACLLVANWCGIATGAEPPQAKPARPNVVVILLDNFGQEWFGCYGSDEGRTPRIDALARGGVRFEHCYTAPICGPSRTVLLTGRYPFRTGFTLHHDAGLYGGGGLDPKLETVFPRLFREAGYKTGIAGKWQINNLYDEPDALVRHGFDEHLVWPGSLDPAKLTGDDRSRFQRAIAADDVPTTVELIQKTESRYWDPALIRNGRREVHPGEYGPDLFQEFALDFLTRHRDEPFLLYYPMVLTHGATFTQPVVPTPANRDANRPHEEIYGDMVAYADRLVGDVVAKLDELGLRDNTYVIIASDNGTESRLAARFRGRKVHGGLYTLTEAGGDTALVVNAPGRVPGGRTVKLADFSDVFPTVCELTGVEIPRDLVLDGRSQAAVLRGVAGAKPAREWIFNQLHTRRVVRDERFKLYSTGELFDAEGDREETQNLAASDDPAAVAARTRLEAVLASLPPDSPPPIKLLSQSAFKLRSAGVPVLEPAK
jgi:arylsulfatase A-like enzyme